MNQIILTNTSHWISLTAYILGQQIITGSNIQQITTAGTSGSSIPTFSSVIGNTTADGSAVWTCVALTSSPVWIVPTDWTSGNTVEVIGSGGDGGPGEDFIATTSSGGGGGGYSKVSNISLTVGDSIPYSIGIHGYPGGDTWFNGATLAASPVGAKGGAGGVNVGSGTAVGGLGGSASSGIGTLKYSGGSGGSSVGANLLGAGGGGAAGPNGNGAKGGSIVSSATNVGSGGGGGGGGSPGVDSTGSYTAGGNNYLGSGSGAVDNAGTNGGGGGGGSTSSGGALTGGNGSEWITAGSGGGGGGGDIASGPGGLYGGGGGGNGDQFGGVVGQGADGVIVISYDFAPSITCDSPPNGIVGTSYTHTFPVTNGTSPFTFSIISGTLPPGLSLNTSTGVVSGTPTTYGIFSFTIQVTDSLSNTASVNCSIAVPISTSIWIDT